MGAHVVKIVRGSASDRRPRFAARWVLPAPFKRLAKVFSRRSGIACDVTLLPVNDAITDDLATALFRIVQEGLTNVSRHAGASHVEIGLGVSGGCGTPEISEDGGGITGAATNRPPSLGV